MIATMPRLLVLLPVGAVWLAAAWLLDDSGTRTATVFGTGLLFTALYLRLLLAQFRNLFRAAPRLRGPMAKTIAALAMYVLGYALAYAGLGIRDNSLPGNPTSHDLAQALYMSVVTFTTLGYGDFAPIGVGRGLAAVEALSGYVVLAIAASTAASLLSPYQRPRLHEDGADGGDGDGSGD